MNTMLTLILLCMSAFVLFRYANYLLNKDVKNTLDTNFQPLIDEIKNIDHLQFKIVSSELIYSKTIGAFLKAMGYLLSFAAIGLTLDFLTKGNTSFHNGDFYIYMGYYLFVGFLFFVAPLLSLLWNYTYFKYGVSDQVKNANIIFDYLQAIPKKILRKYPLVFTVSYIVGRLSFDSGFLSILAGTDLYALGISIYFSLELKRLGLAPVLNLVSEKIKLFQGKTHERNDQK
ncbi:MAG: hypothetical protein ACD_29C00304G0001 [uncultured bacterium]|nr:MAG: hypothetical protein ACD_29C00304G0001 [uncultured bacterium]